ncbi:hypothetical protein DBL07_08680 [Achromobacter mucicolens]|uniref:EAL domain-containing response regulator n=1 Tax=Achromobacter mucicolens TaxID=1389922 RepID=UPI000D3C4766|nr:EAL domain-containing response regulator [Achromobacter mucicolens]PTX06094.1 hypothetical protein DBL07_08680 [Achromobacter mucicolens]
MTKTLPEYKVLIVDDHPLQCVHLADQLAAAGFGQADLASCAETALAKTESQPYHLVLIDLNMAGMDGVQFIDRLARQPHPPTLAIVSACVRRIIESVALMAREKGLDVLGTFSKPFAAQDARQLASQLRQNRQESAPGRPGNELASDRAALESALRQGQLRAWFQPKQSLATGRFAGAEALARWVHPKLGCLSPGAFLPAIRRHGLDKALLRRILQDALHGHLQWSRQGFRVPVSVNLPTQFLDDPDLPDELEEMVLSHRVATSEVTFELLEDETPTVQGQYYMGASRLRLKGFGLAQDDFGRGYSSMYSLISTPFTELKIDRAFVCGAASDESQAAALRSSVQLGRQLGLQVTAEGVETPSDLQFLRQVGCHYAQGFLISAALDTEGFSQLLAQERRALTSLAR